MKAPSILLYQPRFIECTGHVIRNISLTGIQNIFLYDPRGITERIEKTGRLKEKQSSFEKYSAGVSKIFPIEKITTPKEFLFENKKGYRKISTVIAPDAISLFDLEFKPNDLLIFGDEQTGLDDWIVESSDVKVTIPQYNRTATCYTLEAAVAMFCYAYMNQAYLENKRNAGTIR